tara:strand:- start:698 stop:1102 length:405 start_codon:yes stop_codon:yes gene_type:complete
MNFIHRLIIGLSFGRKGWNLAKMPVLELTTTGRKSGIPRSVMLTSPHQENESILIVASKGGSDAPPEWLLNIEKNPNVEVRKEGGPSVSMSADIVNENERNKLWPVITADFPNYSDYQKKTSRVIPLIFLRPIK